MSTPTTGPTSTGSTGSRPAAHGAASTSAPATTAAGGSGLTGSHGHTSIADTVVQKIAGLAARQVNGVYDLGGGAARAFGAVRERIPGARSSSSQGVSVEVGEKQAAVDIELVVEYGVEIIGLARATRRNVTAAIEQMTGLEVVEVNINVNDLHLPGDDTDERPPEPARVQ